MKQEDQEQSQHILTTDDVAIKTLTVEVKVMKIGNRQVTLAVFRQLPEKPILDVLTGELVGIPWGRVNYCPDCKDMVPHFHIVWQKDNELYRATIEKRWQSGPSEDIRGDLLYGEENPLLALNYYVEAYLCARTLEGWLPDEPERRGSSKISYLTVVMEGFSYRFDLDTVSTHLEHLWKAERARREGRKNLDRWEEHLQDSSQHKDYYQRQISNEREHYAQLEQAYQQCHKQSLDWLTSAALPQDPGRLQHEYVLPAYEKYLQYLQRWKASYAQLEALDQLFIAV
jgi:hypothetical protein